MVQVKSTGRYPLARSSLVVYVLLGTGLLLSSVVTRLTVARPALPGKLVARQPELSWRHPKPGEALSRPHDIVAAG